MKAKLQSLRVGIAALGAMTASWAMAQENPYYLGAALGMTHESNLFRVATGQPETSDTFTTTSLLAGVNQPFGRQRFYADAAMRHNRYRDNDQLNNTGYGLSVGLDWETIERLSGKINYLRNRALARAGADQGPALTTKNEETGQEFGASLRYGLASLLSLEAALKHRQLDYSAVEFNSLALKEDSLELGVQRSLSGLLGTAADQLGELRRGSSAQTLDKLGQLRTLGCELQLELRRVEALRLRGEQPPAQERQLVLQVLEREA